MPTLSRLLDLLYDHALKLMVTAACPRLSNMNNDFVLLRFCAGALEDISAVEVLVKQDVVTSEHFRQVLSLSFS